MAATDKRLIAKLVKAKRETGMNDKEIYDEMLTRKDELGNNMRGMTADFQSSGAPNFKGQAAAAIGLDITYTRCSTHTVRLNLINNGCIFIT